MNIQVIKTTQPIVNSLDTTREFGIFLVKATSFIRMIHWYVSNYNSLVILGDLYEDIDELFDKLQEEIIGVVRQSQVTFPKINTQAIILNLDYIPQFNDDGDDILDKYFNLYKEVTNALTSLEFNNFISQVKSGIPNTVDEIISRFNKSNFLLGLTNL